MNLCTTLVRNVVAAMIASLATAAAPPHGAAGLGSSGAYVLEEGKRHKGALYLCAHRITIAGEQGGDLYAMAGKVEVPGTITGDLMLMAGEVDIGGSIGDTVRVAAKSLTLTGTIKGDLLFGGGTLRIAKGARIGGDVRLGGGQLVLDGAVDGDLHITSGEVTLNGTVGGDADLQADIVTIAPEARIAGNLDYTSRNQLDLEGKGIVAGEVQHKAMKPKPRVAFKGVFWWIFSTATALLVGLAALALAGGVTPSIIGTLRTEGLRSAGVGFIAAIAVPVALLLSCILVITIPFVLIALALFALLIYLAKTPVAVAIGSRILKALGHPGPSVFQGLAVGIPVLYLLFAIPLLGKLIRCGCVFAGLGAILIGAWTYRQAHRSAIHPAGPPPVSPS